MLKISSINQIQMQSYLILFVGILFTVAAQIMLKFGMTRNGEVEFSFANLARLIPQLFTNIYLLGALASLGIGLLLWLVVLSKLKLSVVVPFTSLNYVLIMFFSWLFLKEAISLPQLAGVGLIISGLYFVIR